MAHLTKGSISSETLDDATLREYIGGTSLAAKFLYNEVPPDTEWSAPDNRIFLARGYFEELGLEAQKWYRVIAYG